MSIIELVHSMSVAEKRHFTLYAGIKGKDKKPKYVQFFNLINSKLTILDKDLINAGYKTTDKNFLKDKIEESLHDLYLGKSVTSKLKWLTESMERYFNKRQWTELRKCIHKTKETAQKHQQYLDWLQAIFWEKEMLQVLPERKQLFEKLEIVFEEERKVKNWLSEEIDYCNLKASVYALLLKDIRLSNEKNKEKFEQLTSTKLLDNDASPTSVKSKINYYYLKAKVAQYEGNKHTAYNMAKKLMQIFDAHLSFKLQNMDWYKKSLCMLCDICNFSERIEEIPPLIDLIGNENQYFKTVCLHGLMYSINNLDKERGVSYLKKIKDMIENGKYDIRAGRQLSIFYNGAVFFSLFSQWDDMHFWIEKIRTFQRTDDRRDLQYGARILSLINHFELKPDDLDNQIQAVANYYIRNNQYSTVNQYIVKSFRKLSRAINRKEMIPVWNDLKHYLTAQLNETNESTQQLGISELLIWSTSKIENVPMADVFRNL